MKVLMFRGRKYHGAADMATTVWDRSISTTIILSWSKVTGDLNFQVSLGAISTMGVTSANLMSTDYEPTKTYWRQIWAWTGTPIYQVT